MKIKQISLLLAPAFILSATISALVVPADTTNALTQQEKKACYEQWAGGYVGSAGDGKKLTTKQYNNFENKSDCNTERKGSCRIKRFNDGAVIECQRKDGKYDTKSGAWNTSSGGSTGNTGDDGTDTGTTGGTGSSSDGGSISNPVDGDGCAGVATAFIKCDEKNSGDVTDNGIWALLLMALNILTAGVGIVAVAGIVYGAILYTTAEDKADQVKKATDIITNVVIGLVLFALMWSGLNFIVPGGVFQ